eukprot:TRINITY_DN3768_c1_g1_i1.p1 TRINITY_DN3768_c1_g1~~TRINITY_DN3768_c1_g1_i1.p1  ORF type:complete len:495 (-),score=188.49 TRINITY_DN3768_c1_g1_i1:34-1518(-)
MVDPKDKKKTSKDKEKEKDQKQDFAKDQEFEFEKDEAGRDPSDLQAQGAATEEQMRQQEHTDEPDEEVDTDNAEANANASDDTELTEHDEDEDAEVTPSSSKKMTLQGKIAPEQEQDDGESDDDLPPADELVQHAENAEGVGLGENQSSTGILDKSGDPSADNNMDEDEDMEPEADTHILSPEDIHEMREQLDHLLKDTTDIERSAEIWKRLETLTGDLSQELCEQLRLILEPTMATKLQGDYRTGKRINMKKVIPYIASQFKKDKIWLRRTRPNKRQYQVLIAIDDTQSMALYHSGQMALEALTLISRAMARLEVGQIGVVAFGEDMSLVHPFEAPFSDQAGPQVVGRFRFAQQQTDMVSFLAKAVQMLEHVKQGGQGQTMQLMFIISDGWSLRDPANTRKWIREAAQKNIFIVFLVIDNPNPAAKAGTSGASKSHSITQFETVSFVEGKVVRTPYMLDFPFTYYVILRDLPSLPQIIADALRQWFELLKNVE